MSINVDKIDSNKDESPRKLKSTLKRRKKTSSISDLSSGSLSPSKRQFYSNNFSEENQSSPEVSPRISPFSTSGTFNDLFRYSYSLQQNEVHSITMPTTISPTIQSDSKLANGNERTEKNFTNGFGVQQNGLIRHYDKQSTKQSDSSNHNGTDSDSNASVDKGKRQPRTTEDFYLFCQFILEYENYNEIANQEVLRNSTHSPLDSTGSATESTTSSTVIEESNHAMDNSDTSKEESSKVMDVSIPLDESKIDANETVSAIDVSTTNDEAEADESEFDADSYALITCYCGKPYAGRPMIECSQCLTWLHLSCAKIRRKAIPDIFICVKCVKGAHPKDSEGREPKENNRSKRSTSATQTRTDKLENNILQPLNVGTTYETGGNHLENIKTSSATSIAVKYK